MSWRRLALALALLLPAFLVETVVLSRLPIPWATPDLVIVTFASLALVWGPLPGAVTGFAVGLLLDLAPPSDSPAGRWALVLALVGYGVGRLAPSATRGVLVPLAAVAGAAAMATWGYGLLGALLGDSRVEARAVLLGGLASLLYALLLAPFVVPLVMSLARRVDGRGDGRDASLSGALTPLGPRDLR